MTRGKRTWLLVLTSSAAIVAIVATSFALLFAHGAAPAHAASGSGNSDGIGSAHYSTDASAGTVSPSANTIPNWGSSFTDPTNGVTYPYSMVGANPASNSSTTVQFVIIPLDFTFGNAPAGVNPTLAGSSKVQDTLNSPVFDGSADIGQASQTASAAPDGVAPSPRTELEPSDTTQVGDAFVRAQWNKAGTGYHVLLSVTSVLPTQYIAVPKNQGQMLVGSHSHARIGLMSAAWFSAQTHNLMVSLHISPTVVPLFLTYNTFMYQKTLSNCCILGWHGATSSYNGSGKQQVNTYMFAAYSDPGIFGPNPGDDISYIQDIHGLSHEVSEWLDDPFTNNAVNPWLTPTAPQYGCTTSLEVGDPVVGYGFTVTMPSGATYHPEDEVFFSWFARQSPSISSAGYYTYLNNFAGVAQGC